MQLPRLYQCQQQLEKQTRLLQTKLEIATQAHKEQAVWQENQRQRKILQTKIQQLGATFNRKKLEKIVAQWEQDLFMLQKEIKITNEQLKLSITLRKLSQPLQPKFFIRDYQRLPWVINSWEDWLQQVPKILQFLPKRQSKIQQRLISLRKRKNKCPVCGSVLTVWRQHLLYARGLRWQYHLRRIKRFAQACQQVSQLYLSLKPTTTTLIDRTKYLQNLARKNTLIGKIRLTQGLLRKSQRKQELKKQLRALPKLSQPQESLSPLRLTTQISQKKVKGEKVDQQIHLVKRLGKKQANLQECQKKVKKWEETLENLVTQLDKWRKYTTTAQVCHTSLREKFIFQKKITSAILEKMKKAKHLEIYRGLYQAFGPKGLRVQMLSVLGGMFVDNLNHLAREIYSEPYKFSLDLAKNKFDLLATRARKTTDIRSFSGAEGRLFSLLSLLALRPLLPKHLTTNLLVLDEVEAGLSPENQQLLIQEFIPRILQVIPTIFFITPKSAKEFYVPNAQEMLVIRQRGIARIYYDKTIFGNSRSKN